MGCKLARESVCKRIYMMCEGINGVLVCVRVYEWCKYIILQYRGDSIIGTNHLIIALDKGAAYTGVGDNRLGLGVGDNRLGLGVGDNRLGLGVGANRLGLGVGDNRFDKGVEDNRL